METQNRPIENGTAKRNTQTIPAAQGRGQNPSRMASGARAPQARPAPVRRPTQPPRPTTAAPKQNANPAATGRNITARQPIRQMTEDQGSGLMLGSVPMVKDADKKSKRSDWIPTKKSRIKEPMPLATIVFSILCTVLVMFMMINFVKINEYTRDIADMQDHLGKLERQEQELSVELDKKNDLTGIDLEDLGLVKEDSLPKVEIETNNDETTEHFEVEEKETGVVATVMNALYRNFKEYRNIFFGGE